MSDTSVSESYIFAVCIRAKLDATVAVFLNMDFVVERGRVGCFFLEQKGAHG